MEERGCVRERQADREKKQTGRRPRGQAKPAAGKKTIQALRPRARGLAVRGASAGLGVSRAPMPVTLSAIAVIGSWSGFLPCAGAAALRDWIFPALIGGGASGPGAAPRSRRFGARPIWSYRGAREERRDLGARESIARELGQTSVSVTSTCDNYLG